MQLGVDRNFVLQTHKKGLPLFIYIIMLILPQC